jgi:hypothetical protein
MGRVFETILSFASQRDGSTQNTTKSINTETIVKKCDQSNPDPINLNLRRMSLVTKEKNV